LNSFVSPLVFCTVAPITKVESLKSISEVAKLYAPCSEITNCSGRVPCASRVPLTYNDNSFPFSTTATCENPSISVVPTISVHFIPSNTDSFATCSGGNMLFIDRINELSFDTIVNSGEP